MFGLSVHTACLHGSGAVGGEACMREPLLPPRPEGQCWQDRPKDAKEDAMLQDPERVNLRPACGRAFRRRCLCDEHLRSRLGRKANVP